MSLAGLVAAAITVRAGIAIRIEGLLLMIAASIAAFLAADFIEPRPTARAP